MTTAGVADLSALQAAAGLENAAVLAYTTLLGLDLVPALDPAVRRLLTSFRAQHADHAMAFNAAALRAGGAPRVGPDPRLLATLRSGEPGLRTVAAVIALAGSVEDTAGSAYAAAAITARTPALRSLYVSVAGVEAQHRAALDTALALAAGGSVDQPPAALTALPASTGDAGVGGAFAGVTSPSDGPALS